MSKESSKPILERDYKIMAAGCYSLDLYCRYKHDLHGDPMREKQKYNGEGGLPDGEYTGRTLGECKKAARADGWVFNKDGYATCWKCSGQNLYKGEG